MLYEWNKITDQILCDHFLYCASVVFNNFICLQQVNFFQAQDRNSFWLLSFGCPASFKFKMSDEQSHPSHEEDFEGDTDYYQGGKDENIPQDPNLISSLQESLKFSQEMKFLC